MIGAGDKVSYMRFNPLKPDSPETRICAVVGPSTVVEDCIVITWSAGELLTVDHRGVEQVPKTTEPTWRTLDRKNEPLESK